MPHGYMNTKWELLEPQNLPLVSREWKNGSNSSYNCTPFLHSLLTKGKKIMKRWTWQVEPKWQPGLCGLPPAPFLESAESSGSYIGLQESAMAVVFLCCFCCLCAVGVRIGVKFCRVSSPVLLIPVCQYFDLRVFFDAKHMRNMPDHVWGPSLPFPLILNTLNLATLAFDSGMSSSSMGLEAASHELASERSMEQWIAAHRPTVMSTQ